jgi:hypothetical protein
MKIPLPVNVTLTKRTLLVGTAIALIVALAGALLYQHFSSNDQAGFSLASNKPTFVYKCNGSPESILCLEQTYSRYTQQKGVAAAFVKLKAAYNTDTAVHADCHVLAHAIGRTAADNAKSLDDAYAQGDNFCWSGYYHGVMEAVVTKVGERALPTKIPTICADIKKHQPYSFYHYNCVHGLGHGVLDVYQGNIFTALQMCDRLTDSWEQQSCYGGVFMENIMDEISHDRPVDYLKADQPMYPCTAVQEKYKGQCYLMQTSHALVLANENFSQVFTECGQVEAAYVDTCYQSLGRDASGNNQSTVAPTKANCMLGLTQDARANCIVGAVKDFISYYHSDKQANALCQALDSSLQPICQTTKTQYYSTF